NRVGSHATVAQIVAHHREHCVFSVVKRCRENSDTRLHLLTQRITHRLQRREVRRIYIRGHDLDPIYDGTLIDERLDGSAPAAPHRFVQTLLEDTPVLNQSLDASHSLAGWGAYEMLDLLELTFVRAEKLQRSPPSYCLDAT